MSWGWSYAPYVSVAEKRRRAEKEAAKLTKKGKTLSPVRLASKTIASSFWGKSWCENLESYSDFANRMPRGRSYVRNGSVLHLDIRQGEIEALVSGSSLYQVKVTIKPVDRKRWKGLCRESAGSIGSLMELLQGKLSERVMGVMTRRETGLFPSPKEIALDCSCPDWADMCKHVAAVLYGVGARLDEKPELLFLLRHVDHQELVSQADTVTALTATKPGAAVPTLSEKDVGDVFGIEIDSGAAAKSAPAKPAPLPRPPKTPTAPPVCRLTDKQVRAGNRGRKNLPVQTIRRIAKTKQVGKPTHRVAVGIKKSRSATSN